MADVFISYSHQTASQAQVAAKALRSLGYSVWFDDDLLAHQAYTRVIEEQTPVPLTNRTGIRIGLVIL